MSLWPEAPFNINAACLCEEAAEPSINNKQSLGTKLKATISISSCISLHESNRDDFWGEMLHALNFLGKKGKKSAVKAVLGASLIDLLVNCCTCIIKTLRQTDASVCTPEKKIVENKLIFFSFEYLWKREQKH